MFRGMGFQVAGKARTGSGGTATLVDLGPSYSIPVRDWGRWLQTAPNWSSAHLERHLLIGVRLNQNHIAE